MSPALDLLEQRKQAGLFGATRMPTGIYESALARTNWLRDRYAKNPPKPAPAPAPMAPQQFPASVLAAKAKSMANTAQIQGITQAVQKQGPAPAPAPVPQAELDARHATTVNALKAVEASRLRNTTPTTSTKTACLDCPALTIVQHRGVQSMDDL